MFERFIGNLPKVTPSIKCTHRIQTYPFTLKPVPYYTTLLKTYAMKITHRGQGPKINFLFSAKLKILNILQKILMENSSFKLPILLLN